MAGYPTAIVRHADVARAVRLFAEVKMRLVGRRALRMLRTMKLSLAPPSDSSILPFSGWQRDRMRDKRFFSIGGKTTLCRRGRPGPGWRRCIPPPWEDSGRFGEPGISAIGGRSAGLSQTMIASDDYSIRRPSAWEATVGNDRRRHCGESFRSSCTDRTRCPARIIQAHRIPIPDHALLAISQLSLRDKRLLLFSSRSVVYGTRERGRAGRFDGGVSYRAMEQSLRNGRGTSVRPAGT